MKILAFILLMVIATGCSTIGKFTQNFAKGYNDTIQAQGNDERKTTNCTSYVNGSYVNTTCN